MPVIVNINNYRNFIEIVIDIEYTKTITKKKYNVLALPPPNPSDLIYARG